MDEGERSYLEFDYAFNWEEGPSQEATAKDVTRSLCDQVTTDLKALPLLHPTVRNIEKFGRFSRANGILLTYGANQHGISPELGMKAITKFNELIDAFGAAQKVEAFIYQMEGFARGYVKAEVQPLRGGASTVI